MKKQDPRRGQGAGICAHRGKSAEDQGFESHWEARVVTATSDSLSHFVLSNHLQGQRADSRGWEVS